MGRGTGTLELAAPRHQVVSRARAANSINPAQPEVIELCTRGNVSVYAENKFGISREDFLLMAAVERILEANERSYATAREVSGEIYGADTHAISLKLRQLAKEGHLESESSGKGLTFSPVRALDEYYSWHRIVLPSSNRGRGFGGSVSFLRTAYGRMHFTGQGAHEDIWHSTGIKDFQTGASVIARQVLEGKESGFELVRAGDAPSGQTTLLAMFPYRFKKGLRQEPTVALKFVGLGGSANVSWRGSDFETSFLDGVVRAQDLLDASKLLENKRFTECTLHVFGP